MAASRARAGQLGVAAHYAALQRAQDALPFAETLVERVGFHIFRLLVYVGNRVNAPDIS
jgi:hypothetical protein